MTQLTWPEQDPQFIIEKNTPWSHQDLPEAPNTTIHGQGHAPGTENVSIQQQYPRSATYAWRQRLHPLEYNFILRWSC